ncbi:hypothetical protein [Ralstonia phage RP31]|uniref:Uncharacterized protein n=2 Tax=Ripduovirus RP12 TaxID=2560700 RepID=A0A1L7N0X5_9CAUD|nr:hypothetical protein FDH28_gp264 [Ralstonia phage RP12]BAW19131.1 hypothetical protein [Ralstonia phage RP12]BAW19417.1 hypothetical protein [Ralstonia phage RP31]
MNEVTFLEQLAAEVMKRNEPRLQQLLEWCKNTAAVLQQCCGVTEQQAVHAAATAGALYGDICNIELTGEIPEAATCDTTALSWDDIHYVMYNYRVDAEKRTISVIPSVMKIIPGQVIEKHKAKRSESLQFEPLVLELSADAVVPESVIALS